MVKSERHYKIQSSTSKSMRTPSPTSSSSSSSSQLACKKKYKGIRMRSWGSWVSEIRAPNQKARIWLGSYSTPEAAARAYDAALLCLKGPSANLNFPITPSHCIPDTVLSPKSIQRVAAAAAANSFADTNGNNHKNTNSLDTTNPPLSSPPLPSYSSPSPSSSATVLSSRSIHSPSYQIDDDVSKIQFLGSYNDEIPSILDSWYNGDDLLLPKSYLDHMFLYQAFTSNPPVLDDLYEGDICLWSFNE